MTLMFLCANLS